jgi:YfiH family protein
MYQISELKKFPELVHAFSTKKEGNMSFLWGPKNDVLKNREKFLSQLQIPLDAYIVLELQDKDLLLIAEEKFSKKKMESHKNAVAADGLITKEKNLYLFLLTADCLPIIFFDSKKKVIGVAHAGWRSTEAKIAFKTVKKMQKEFGCRAADICVAIGPAIHKNSYIFKNPMQKKLGDLVGWKPFLKDLPGGRTTIDIVGYNKKQLEEAGIPSQNIFISPIDTARDSNFFSHYRASRKPSENEGRFACVVGLKT